MGGFSRAVVGLVSAREAEAMGVREVLNWLKNKVWSNLQIEMDDFTVYSELCSASNATAFGLLIEDCRNLSSTIKNVISLL